MGDSDTISLDKSEQRKLSRKTHRLKQDLKSGKVTVKEFRQEQKRNTEETTGLVYIGHLPHGFYEQEIADYFSQFGRMTNCKVCRSKKTGNSKGYGFVEFRHPEVAKIAADTMNNYIMFKRRIVAEYIPQEKRPKDIFHGRQSMPGKFSTLRRRVRNNQSRNRKISEEEHLKQSRAMQIRLQKKMKRLQKLGIDYDLKPADVPEKV